MPQIEVFIPEEVDAQIDRFIDEGEFITREEAVEELLSMGLSTYDTTGHESEGDLSFAEEMQNPGEKRPSDDDRGL